MKKAFSAAALILVGGLTTNALADEIPNAPPSDTVATIIPFHNADDHSPKTSQDTLDSILASASDATEAEIRYNKYFIKDTIALIKKYFVGEKTTEELEALALEGLQKLKEDSPSYTIDQYVEAALDGILNKLDPHSDYLPPVTAKEKAEMMSGHFSGIGARLDYDEKRKLPIIVEPIPDSPAEKAGLKAGDVITHFNKKSTHKQSLEGVVGLIKGKAGTSVDLTIKRNNKSMNITITRADVENNPVTHKIIDNIGYIKLDIFSNHASEYIKEAIQTIQDDPHAADIKGYILDLRNNPGGYLKEAVRTADLFLNDGMIVSMGDSNKKVEHTYDAEPGDILNGTPLIVLTNGGSASASEIVAQTLQDHKRATIMGTSTYGKGTAYASIPLGDYFYGREDTINITTDLYYTPSGTTQTRGVLPNVETGFRGTTSSGWVGQSEATQPYAFSKPDWFPILRPTTHFYDASGVMPDLNTLGEGLILNLRDGTKEADMQLLCALEHFKGQEHYTKTVPIDQKPSMKEQDKQFMLKMNNS